MESGKNFWRRMLHSARAICSCCRHYHGRDKGITSRMARRAAERETRDAVLEEMLYRDHVVDPNILEVVDYEEELTPQARRKIARAHAESARGELISGDEVRREEMTVLDALCEARALIADESCWTTYASARVVLRNGREEPCDPKSPLAAKWSGRGAVKRVAGSDAIERAALDLLDAASPTVRGYRNDLSAVNDYAGHAAVLAVYDDVIRALGRGEI